LYVVGHIEAFPRRFRGGFFRFRESAVLKKYRITAGRLVQVQDDPAHVCVYVSPDEEERKRLVSEMKIDEHTLVSALDPDELSRLEFEPEHMAAIFKRPKSYTGGPHFELGIGSTGAFLFKKQLIILLAEDVPVLDYFMNVRVSTVASLFLKMLYRSIYHFLEHLKVINKISDELQDKINTSMENRYLINLFELQKSLVYYLSSINSNAALIEKLKHNTGKTDFTPEDIEFLDDIFIENNQCYKQAEMLSNILASLMDARASIVSNNLNILMKMLNLITIGIMVPTFVVSAFSMNVRIPLSELHNAFWMILGMAAISVAGLVVYLRYKKW
jgi:magnesium transporter